MKAIGAMLSITFGLIGSMIGQFIFSFRDKKIDRAKFRRIIEYNKQCDVIRNEVYELPRNKESYNKIVADFDTILDIPEGADPEKRQRVTTLFLYMYRDVMSEITKDNNQIPHTLVTSIRLFNEPWIKAQE